MAEQRREEYQRIERTAPDGSVSETPVEQVEIQDHAASRPQPETTNVNVSAPARPAPTNVNVAPASAEPAPDYSRPAWAVGKVNQILWYFAAVLEALLGLRFILRLIGANPAAPFGAFIYAVTQPLLWPFEGLVANPGVRGGPVFELITLVAMIVYFLLFLAITQLLRLLVSRPREQF
jgi:uncharacterized protein YggT (Ycf19 family)